MRNKRRWGIWPGKYPSSKKQGERIPGILVCMLLILCFSVTAGSAAEESKTYEAGGYSLTYDLEESNQETTAVITGSSPAAEITVPGQIDGYQVSKIEGLNGELLETLIIEDGVRYIEKNAFQGFERLRKVVLPDSIFFIGQSAFEDCHVLAEINMPKGLGINGLTSGGTAYRAFHGVAMEDIVLSNGTSLAAESADAYDHHVGFATYQDGWYFQKLEDGTLRIADCDRTDSELIIPGSIGGDPVSTLGAGIFAGKGLKKVTLPEGLREIEEGAFYLCESLEDVQLPESLQKIGTRAFVGIKAENLTMPAGARDQSAAFWYASLIRSSGDWQYAVLEDGTAVVTDTLSSSANLTIPTEIDGILVTMIAGISDQEKASLKEDPKSGSAKVTYHNLYLNRTGFLRGYAPISVQSAVQNSAAWKNVANLTVSDGIREITDDALFNCPNLKKLVLPETLKRIGALAFYGNQIAELEIPAGVRQIGDGAFSFSDKQAIKKVSFPNPRLILGKGVLGFKKSSGPRAFNPKYWKDYFSDKSNAKISAVTVTCYAGSTADALYAVNVKKNYLKADADTVRTAPADRVLKAGLFDPEELIFELIIPEGVEEIADKALSGLTMLNKVTLPDTLKVIGAHAFDGCRGLSELKLPKGVTQIGEACFAGCVGLKKINLPEGITEIPDYAFSGCASLSKAELPKGSLLKIGAYAFSNCPMLTDVKLNKGLEAIGEYAFEKSGLKKASIPDSVASLGQSAFMNCNDLTSLVLPKGITEIPDELCAGCRDLNKVTIPKGVIRIGEAAFAYHNLSSLTLPEGLDSIGKNAFRQNSTEVSTAYSLKGTVSSLKSLTVPASLKTIDEMAFAGCDALASIKFAKNAQLSEIGDQAFTWCVKLKEIALPDTVVSIGERAFMFCPGLTKADLGNSIVSIGNEAFLNCEKMTSLTVPDTLTSLGTNLIGGHGAKLTVTCGEGSAMEAWLRENDPAVTVVHPKTKK